MQTTDPNAPDYVAPQSVNPNAPGYVAPYGVAQPSTFETERDPRNPEYRGGTSDPRNPNYAGDRDSVGGDYRPAEPLPPPSIDDLVHVSGGQWAAAVVDELNNHPSVGLGVTNLVKRINDRLSIAGVNPLKITELKADLSAIAVACGTAAAANVAPVEVKPTPAPAVSTS